MKDITAIIPVSAIPTHPSSEILDETIKSVRERLPEIEIILMFDGVADAKTTLKDNYELFKQNMLWRIEHEMENVTPLVFEKHMHQSLMMIEALKIVRTPTILFLEQDTPLHNEIPFEKLIEPITTGYIDVIRFHFEAQVHPEHEYLMLDKEPIDILGVPFLRTRQWSQRPHLASTNWYRAMVDKYFDDQPRFIEHILYGRIVEGNFEEFKVHIYAPDGTLVRSKHLDGRRAGAESYDPSAS